MRKYYIERQKPYKKFYYIGGIPFDADTNGEYEFTEHNGIEELRLFSKEERSSFKYWFAHWAAFNMVALTKGVWKPRHLFHDWEKPWMRLFLEYDKVRNWHRTHRKHHLQYGIKHGMNKVCWLDLAIDWECGRYTKYNAPLDARDTMAMRTKKEDLKPYKEEIEFYLEKALIDLGL